jgi:hypothetical protein
VALPLPARIGLCVGAATLGLAGIRSCFLLAGRRSVRALAWTDTGDWFAYLGPRQVETPVVPGTGCFRLPGVGLILWLEECDGIHAVFIDAGKQEQFAIRRLIRQLQRPREAGSQREPRQADTIRPRV